MNISGFFLERGFTDVVQENDCFHGEMSILPAEKQRKGKEHQNRSQAQ